MKEWTIVGVSRGSEFSPNHVDNDAAIFNRVVEVLREQGCTVLTVTEREFVADRVEGDVVFNMARDGATLQRLKELEDQGALVVNSAYGIGNCVRKPMTELLVGHGVPHPESVIVPTDVPYEGAFYPCWLKRADSHAMVKEDVSYATCSEEANRALEGFRNRGIREAVVNRHLQGDLVKFYGVQDTDFFYWFYPDTRSHSKFGLEVINGEAQGIPFEVAELKGYSDRAAEVLGVPVYGGDCVVMADGGVKIIDFNDWPSFARCRQEAGAKIAECILKRVERKYGHE